MHSTGAGGAINTYHGDRAACGKMGRTWMWLFVSDALSLKSLLVSRISVQESIVLHIYRRTSDKTI